MNANSASFIWHCLNNTAFWKCFWTSGGIYFIYFQKSSMRQRNERQTINFKHKRQFQWIVLPQLNTPMALCVESLITMFLWNKAFKRRVDIPEEIMTLYWGCSLYQALKTQTRASIRKVMPISACELHTNDLSIKYTAQGRCILISSGTCR